MGKKTEELKKKTERDCLNLISLAKVKSVYAKNLLNVLQLNDEFGSLSCKLFRICKHNST